MAALLSLLINKQGPKKYVIILRWALYLQIKICRNSKAYICTKSLIVVLQNTFVNVQQNKICLSAAA